MCADAEVGGEDGPVARSTDEQWFTGWSSRVWSGLGWWDVEILLNVNKVS